MWFFILVSVVVAAILYFWSIKPFNYWEKLGIPYVKPTLFLGNMGPILLRRKTFPEMVDGYYFDNHGKRYFGIYQFISPILIIRDIELIKKITVKDFDVFPVHRTFASEEIDPLWAKNLFAMSNPEKWHDMRSTLSPSFTSNKMKIMFGLIKDCSKQFSKYYLKSGGTLTVEMKDAFTRFTNDVIASTAFGVTCDSLENKSNEFFVMGRNATNFGGLRSLRFFLYTISPTLMKLLNVGIINREISRFFTGIVKETVTVREKEGIVRPDMIHLLMEARKGRLRYDEDGSVKDAGFAAVEESERGKSQKRQRTEITDEDMTAQALIFFLAGFDTVSTAMVFTTYELVANTGIQKRLQEEIDRTLKECNGDLTYEALMGMKYLDMVVSETLRKWPPALFTDRKSVKPYTIDAELPNEKPIVLPTGSVCWIPVHCIHWDPKYYPQPELYDPERFNDENKHLIKPFTYMPFGLGPRNCIGSRFALLETKIIITEILSKFDLVPVEKTQIPLKLSKSNFTPLPEKGLWVGFKPRA